MSAVRIWGGAGRSYIMTSYHAPPPSDPLSGGSVKLDSRAGGWGTRVNVSPRLELPGTPATGEPVALSGHRSREEPGANPRLLGTPQGQGASCRDAAVRPAGPTAGSGQAVDLVVEGVERGGAGTLLGGGEVGRLGRGGALVDGGLAVTEHGPSWALSVAVCR